MLSNKLLVALAPLALAGLAEAQNFNLDVGANQNAPLPTAAYGAAALQPGTWFGVSTTTPVNLQLVDVNNVTTNVFLNWTGGTGDFWINNPAWTADDDRLMEDATDVNGVAGGFGTMTWTLSGLAGGTYEIYTYAAAPDFPAFYNTRVAVTGAVEAAQICNGNWTGSPHVLGVSYAKHTVTVAGGGNVVIVTDDPQTVAGNLATVNGFQIKQIGFGAVGAPFCFGDGTGGACPCGNLGGAGNGCANSVNALGANLAASGSTSLTSDSVVLGCSGMPNSTALYFQGTAQQNGGLGSAFGDGLRCAGGSTVRLGTKTNVAGASQYPGAGDPTVSVKGNVTVPGTRTYQVWYRNAAAFCTVSTFNLSNGLQITWGP